jgi:predicted transcriptional regulator of viral defense system
MRKTEFLVLLLQENNGYIRTSEATGIGVSRAYFREFAKRRGLERVAHGLYRSQDAWDDGLYVIQARYPNAVFSHETALFLLNLAEREPAVFSVTLKAGANATGLTKGGIKAYKVNDAHFHEGIIEAKSPGGHPLRTYCPERTICDLFRSRRNVEIQVLQGAIKEFVRLKSKDIPLLMRFAKTFSIEKIIRPYLEVLL